ncbi:MAG: extracellular solute-binding protein [Clostridia bacterium]|nr:extracellular solute-binding protein [Clostridia bacterium]
MKKALAFLMIFAMLFLSAACGEAGDKNETSVSDPAPGSAAMTDANAETEAPETEAKLLPDIPDRTYDGQSFRFLSREVVDAVVRFYSEIASNETNGEIMNDTVFERTNRIEKNYDVKIVNDTSPDVTGQYQKTYLAGQQDWDVLVAGFSAVLGQTNNGYTLDLSTVPYIDLEKPWWDTNVAKSMRIGNSVFSAVGAMNTWTDSHTYAVVFNKELAKAFDIDAYGLVRGNKWNLDTFAAILEQVTNDEDGNGEMDHNDRYGAVGEFFNFNLHVLASDVFVIGHDEEGLPVLDLSERLFTVADRVCTLMCSGNYLLAEKLQGKVDDVWGNGLRFNFRSGNSLFYVGGIEQLLIFRDLDTDIGLLPFPKYDEAQAEYHHTFSTYWSSILFLPRNSETTDFTGAMLEAMNADSYYSTSIAYYDVVLKGKAMRDEESCEMLEIIRQSRTIDPELAYNFLGASGAYTAALQSGSADKLASTFEKTKKVADKNIQKLINNIGG